MYYTYTVITDHALKRFMDRSDCDDLEKAEKKLKKIYNKLTKLSINNDPSIEYSYKGNGRYLMSNEKHKIIFTKNRKSSENVIITYVNLDKEKPMDKELLFKLGLLGTKL